MLVRVMVRTVSWNYHLRLAQTQKVKMRRHRPSVIALVTGALAGSEQRQSRMQGSTTVNFRKVSACR